MTLALHNPSNQAHIEDLKDRLRAQLVRARSGDGTVADLIESLAEVVRAMDRGDFSVEEAGRAFSQDRVPGFSFGRWLGEMVDEGIYVEFAYSRAA
jgi:hypothetical protein